MGLLQTIKQMKRDLKQKKKGTNIRKGFQHTTVDMKGMTYFKLPKGNVSLESYTYFEKVRVL